MSNKQRENNLSRRRENYRRRKEQEKQAQTSLPINSQSRVPFQNFTNMTFPRSHFQGTHDSEADPNRNCTSLNQRNNTSQSDTDDMDVDEALEDAVISYVNMDARENGALSRRPQDNYVKIESGRLRWIKENQSDIRSELYQGLHDALHVGETNAENIGKRTILPSSFIGVRRDMTQRYEDGMAIFLNGSKPYIFLTMTCNPSWSEITSELLPFQTPQDRPDLLTRIFRSKFEKLKDDVINKGVLKSNDNLHDPIDYDSMVRAEIPKLECEPQLHEAVERHMIHGPYDIINRKSPCMKDEHCKKRYPKQFLDETRQGTDSYPEYRRRFDESVSLGKDRFVDNRWVVPYNPWLLLKYDCHINVEICSSIKSIKYLYKYV
ncbi:hypothetical protein KIW84_042594 [Lathyrus oleraceus]|uniref:Helitron helicase-like domain-containing protein n=1 Tax=Pisum sativum TaxID=3888 RepID=A0A9D5AT90_PEA|nr:hypothetical protein KIW84_042594 [Pisum sativum]